MKYSVQSCALNHKKLFHEYLALSAVCVVPPASSQAVGGETPADGCGSAAAGTGHATHWLHVCMWMAVQ